MSQSKPGYPRLESMASGEQAIAIGKCSYEEFPECGRVWAARLGARVLEAISSSKSERPVLAFDESFFEISLEPQDAIAGKLIHWLYCQIELMK